MPTTTTVSLADKLGTTAVIDEFNGDASEFEIRWQDTGQHSRDKWDSRTTRIVTDGKIHNCAREAAGPTGNFCNAVAGASWAILVRQTTRRNKKNGKLVQAVRREVLHVYIGSNATDSDLAKARDMISAYNG